MYIGPTGYMMQNNHQSSPIGASILCSSARIALCFIALIVSLSGIAHPTELTVGLGGLASIGDFTKRADYGFTATASAGLAPFKNSADLLLLGRLSYDSFGGISSHPDRSQFICTGLEMKLRLPTEFSRSYCFSVGGGISRVRLGEANAVTTNNPFLSPALGIEVGAPNHTRIYLEARFTYISGGTSRDIQFLEALIGLIL